eukprot:4075950-Alexandrium_andersonii.AAC.1
MLHLPPVPLGLRPCPRRLSDELAPTLPLVSPPRQRGGLLPQGMRPLRREVAFRCCRGRRLQQGDESSREALSLSPPCRGTTLGRGPRADAGRLRLPGANRKALLSEGGSQAAPIPMRAAWNGRGATARVEHAR